MIQKTLQILFTDIVIYRQNKLIKSFVTYNNDLVRELCHRIKNVTSQIKDGNFVRKDLLTIIAFLKNIRSACDACSSQKGDTVWIFKCFQTRPVGSVIKIWAILLAETLKT